MQTFIIKYRARSGRVKKEKRLGENHYDVAVAMRQCHGIGVDDILSIQIRSKKLQAGAYKNTFTKKQFGREYDE